MLACAPSGRAGSHHQRGQGWQGPQGCAPGCVSTCSLAAGVKRSGRQRERCGGGCCCGGARVLAGGKGTLSGGCFCDPACLDSFHSYCIVRAKTSHAGQCVAGNMWCTSHSYFAVYGKLLKTLRLDSCQQDACVVDADGSGQHATTSLYTLRLLLQMIRSST